VVRQIEKMLGRIIGEDVRLETRLSPDVKPVMIDPAHMHQVIMNLAVNSRDAMPEGGKLLIETADVELTSDYTGRHIGVEAGNYTMLAITDTGSGMDETIKTHLFEPFFTTKEQGKGTGLGLSIVYGIVKQSGGEILVYSEPDRGTVFKIYLPVATHAPQELESREEAEAAAPAAETVLLVEDDQQVRQLTRTMLTARGYRVVEAASSAEALKLIADPGEIHLLLTDMVMPGMTGADLARQIKQTRPRIRVLYMSGYTEIGVIDRGLINSETQFLRKPFTAGALHRKIREVMGRE
jgi:CheY-like chemotaxis protein